MCKMNSHAVNACAFKYKLCFVLKSTYDTKSVYGRDVK